MYGLIWYAAEGRAQKVTSMVEAPPQDGCAPQKIKNQYAIAMSQCYIRPRSAPHGFLRTTGSLSELRYFGIPRWPRMARLNIRQSATPFFSCKSCRPSAQTASDTKISLLTFLRGGLCERAVSGGKFVVSRAGGAYDARDRGPNRKFVIGSLISLPPATAQAVPHLSLRTCFGYRT